MTRQLAAMTGKATPSRTTSTTMTKMKTMTPTSKTALPPLSRLGANGTDTAPSATTFRAGKQKSNSPPDAFHRPRLTNSSSTTTTSTTTTTTKASLTVSAPRYEDPLMTDSGWAEVHARRAFVRRNASVALGCGLILFLAFVVFASVKLKSFWLPRLRARGRRGNMQNREADYLINGMYL